MPKKKILVVDDEVSLVSVLAQRLRLQNYDVVTALDGVQALDKALNEQPDLIISDVMMPNMDGYTFVRQLRAAPSLSHIPVIILTGQAKTEDLFLFQGVKGCDFVVKAGRSDELFEKISQVLERVQQHLGPASDSAPPPTPA